VLFCRPASVASNSSLSAVAYVPVAGSHCGELAARLRQRCPDRLPGLANASCAVSPQRSCAADFQLASLRPYLWRTHKPSLSVPERIRSNVAVLVYKVLDG